MRPSRYKFFSSPAFPETRILFCFGLTEAVRQFSREYLIEICVLNPSAGGAGATAKDVMSLTQILLRTFTYNSIRSSWLLMKFLQHHSKQQEKHIQEPSSVSDQLYKICPFIIPLLCPYGLFIDACVSKTAVLSKDVISYLHWYNVIRWAVTNTKNLLFLMP